MCVAEDGLEDMAHRDCCYLKMKMTKERQDSRSRMEDCNEKQGHGTSEGVRPRCGGG